MLEFILIEGQTLPFIGSSANEAEVLLKPGNKYRCVKRYKVKYIREIHTGTEPMLIYIYQFLLTNDTNPFLTGMADSVPDVPAAGPDVPDVVPVPARPRFDYNDHKYWSHYVNEFKDMFARMAGIPESHDLTQGVTGDFELLEPEGGSKRRTKKRRQYKTKRRQYKSKRRRTNKRRRRQCKTKRRRI